MERFEGNGAECMVRFIADGCNGTVHLVGNDIPFVHRDVWNDHAMIRVDFLQKGCIYTPPEPIWREVTPGQALDAWLDDKVVQRRADSLDDAISDGEWYEIEPRTSAKAYNRWNVCRSKFRIQGDA